MGQTDITRIGKMRISILFVVLMLSVAIVVGIGCAAATDAQRQTTDQGDWETKSINALVIQIGEGQRITSEAPSDIKAQGESAAVDSVANQPPSHVNVNLSNLTLTVTYNESSPTNATGSTSAATGGKTQDVKPDIKTDIPVNITPGAGAKIGSP
jgi:hypothetical protein